LLRQLELNPQQRSAQSLAPAIRRLVAETGWTPAQVQLVAVAIGPGSFTGLRVGVTTAKVFADAVGADILGVDTLEAVATAAPPQIHAVSAAIDAQRGDVVAAWFHRGPDGWFVPTEPARLLAAEEWLGRLTPGVFATGPALRKYASRLPPGLAVLESQHWAPQAAMVGQLAAHLYAAGRRDDLWTIGPRYSRRSAAEEKRDEEGGGKGGNGKSPAGKEGRS
jgi:tRNA threonylcarbamoyladenosine biosynthesis protein TsaB